MKNKKIIIKKHLKEKHETAPVKWPFESSDLRKLFLTAVIFTRAFKRNKIVRIQTCGFKNILKLWWLVSSPNETTFNHVMHG